MDTAGEGLSVSVDELKKRGDEAFRARLYQVAIQSYSQALERTETSALYTNRAAASLMLLLFKEANADCDRALAIDAAFVRAWFRKATALRGIGRLDDAISALEKGLEMDGSNDAAIKELSMLRGAKNDLQLLRRAVNEEKQFKVSLTKLEGLIREIGGGFRDFNILKMVCLLNLNRTEDAYNLSNAMMRVSSNGDVELLHVRAECLYSMGDIENCLKHLQQAVRSDPDNTKVRAYYRIIRDIEEKKEAGAAAFKRGEFLEAASLWAAAISLVDAKESTVKAERRGGQVKAKLHFNRGTALSKLKKHESAATECDSAIALDPSYLKAYVKRAECNFALGGADRIKRCIADYEKVQELQAEEEGPKIDCARKIKEAKVALKRAGRKDFYAILGVAQNADEDDIKKAYKKAALKYHPDRHSSSTEEEKSEAERKFKEVGEAYECLTDPEKKERYDSGVDPEDLDNPHAGGCGHGHGGHGGGMGGIDPNILFQMFMAQQGSGGGGGRGGGGRGGGFHFG